MGAALSTLFVRKGAMHTIPSDTEPYIFLNRNTNALLLVEARGAVTGGRYCILWAAKFMEEEILEI